MLETLTALLMTKLLAQFNTRKETAMTTMSKIRPVNKISAMLFFPQFCPFVISFS